MRSDRHLIPLERCFDSMIRGKDKLSGRGVLLSSENLMPYHPYGNGRGVQASHYLKWTLEMYTRNQIDSAFLVIMLSEKFKRRSSSQSFVGTRGYHAVIFDYHLTKCAAHKSHKVQRRNTLPSSTRNFLSVINQDS